MGWTFSPDAGFTLFFQDIGIYSSVKYSIQHQKKSNAILKPRQETAIIVVHCSASKVSRNSKVPLLRIHCIQSSGFKLRVCVLGSRITKEQPGTGSHREASFARGQLREKELIKIRKMDKNGT